jgi:hypothetical protein
MADNTSVIDRMGSIFGMQVEARFGKCKCGSRIAAGGSIFPHRLVVTRLSSHATAIDAAQTGGGT